MNQESDKVIDVLHDEIIAALMKARNWAVTCAVIGVAGLVSILVSAPGAVRFALTTMLWIAWLLWLLSERKYKYLSGQLLGIQNILAALKADSLINKTNAPTKAD